MLRSAAVARFDEKTLTEPLSGCPVRVCCPLGAWIDEPITDELVPTDTGDTRQILDTLGLRRADRHEQGQRGCDHCFHQKGHMAELKNRWSQPGRFVFASWPSPLYVMRASAKRNDGTELSSSISDGRTMPLICMYSSP